MELDDIALAGLASLFVHEDREPDVGETIAPCDCNKCAEIKEKIRQAVKPPRICILCNRAMGHSDSMGFSRDEDDGSFGVAHVACIDSRIGGPFA